MYKSLQACRAIAALSIVVYHLGGTIASPKYFDIKYFETPLYLGHFGVSFFFLLSGFIISHVHRRDISNPRRLLTYIFKRTSRVYTTYWLILFPVYVVALLTLQDSVPTDPLILLKTIFLLPQDPSVVGGTGAPILIVAWSLQYEMCFYAFFALLIFNWMLGIAAALTLLAAGVIYSGDPSQPFLVSFLLQPLVALFVMGMAASFACTSGKLAVKRPLILAGAGGVLLLVFAVEGVPGLSSLGGWKLIGLGIAGSLIIFGLVISEDRGIVVGENKFVQLIGDSSYALYLIHYPLISIMSKISVAMNLHIFGLLGASVAFLVMLAACVFSSVAFYLWIEKPLLRRLRNHNARTASGTKYDTAKVSRVPQGESRIKDPLTDAQGILVDRTSAQ